MTPNGALGPPLADLWLWLRADKDIYQFFGGPPCIDGGLCGGWRCQIDPTREYGATVADRMPTWHAAGLAGQASIQFDGTNDCLAYSPVAHAAADWTCCFVCHPHTMGVTRPLSSHNNPDLIWSHRGGIPADTVQLRRLSVWQQDGPSATIPQALTFHCSGVNCAVYRNTALIGNIAWAAAAIGSNSRVGADAGPTPTFFFDGHIAEILYWPRTLTPGEVTQLNTYLKARYALW